MELAESIESINSSLVDEFGIDSDTGRPIWRVVWSDDQREKRLSEFTLEGIQLIHPEVMELPKYSWIRERYVLERLVIIPDINAHELPTRKLSYEPIWVFNDHITENYIPPTFMAAKFVVDTVYAAQGKSGLRKYVDPEGTKEGAREAKEKRISKLEEELFGDESCLMMRTKTGEAVGYTGEPKINNLDKES